MNLSELSKKVGKRKARKRCGRGRGSGLGKTSGRGQKGAGARSGFSLRLSHAGGQVSFIRHIAKRGFTNHPFRRRYDVVNLDVLETAFDAGASVSLESLAERGLLKVQHGRLKILGSGSLTKSLQVQAHAVSAAARQKIEAAGGRIEILGSSTKKRSE